MSGHIQRVTPFLWFDSQAQEAAELYTSVFPRSQVDRVLRYGQKMAEATGRIVDSVMAVEFTLDGNAFTAFNGGPHLLMNGSVSFVVNCHSQDEVDYYWSRLTEGGDPSAQQCGWLLDRFGTSWQVVPTRLTDLLASPSPEVAGRVGVAMLKMKKIDVAELERASE